MVEFISDYDSLTVDEVADRLDSLSVDELIQLRLYESGNKDRVTVNNAIERQLDGRDTEPESLSPDDAENERDGDEDQRMSDGDGEVSPSGDEPEVTIRVDGRGYFGGHWFDSAGEYTVQMDLRLEQAIGSNSDIHRV